ncbi:hypothetical protein M1555_05515 [Patescibacteria group bacterium]|nr:hypothetical protein [Patescibacteria group bacterium]
MEELRFDGSAHPRDAEGNAMPFRVIDEEGHTEFVPVETAYGWNTGWNEAAWEQFTAEGDTQGVEKEEA